MGSSHWCLANNMIFWDFSRDIYDLTMLQKIFLFKEDQNIPSTDKGTSFNWESNYD